MKIAVLASDEQWMEITARADMGALVRISSLNEIDDANACVVTIPVDKESVERIRIPVLMNAVTETLTSMKLPENVLRINCWKGFLERTTWEVAGKVTGIIETVFTALGRQYIEVADEPGLVSARTIAMIINEAYFALGENVSTHGEIDTAMKLGTNYPYGPFEWADRVGVKNIYVLLSALAVADKRYTPAPLLKQAATK